jgi:hypothetical protein
MLHQSVGLLQHLSWETFATACVLSLPSSASAGSAAAPLQDAGQHAMPYKLALKLT